MAVAARPDELARLQVALLRHHVREQGVGGDVEGHAEQRIGAALIELAGEPPARHVELKQRMAGQQSHLLELAHVPGAHDQAARVRVRLDLLDDVRELIDGATVRRGQAAPLLAVNRAELAVLIGPLVPDADAVLAQVADVGVALEEPQQLVNDGLAGAAAWS